MVDANVLHCATLSGSHKINWEIASATTGMVLAGNAAPGVLDNTSGIKSPASMRRISHAPNFVVVTLCSRIAVNITWVCGG